MKLHLTATVPSEGARRVAQWIVSLPGGVTEAAKVLDASPEWVERIVAGDMVPGQKAGSRLVRLCGVQARHFNARPAGWWFDAPAPLARAA